MLRMGINKRLWLWALIALTIGSLSAVIPADFAVTGIQAGADGFVYVELKNKTNEDILLSPELKEKVFLVIYINNLKRAEYKIKYLDPKLFKKQGVVMLRTNFRVQKPIDVRAEVNPLKAIPEVNLSDNRLAKRVSAGN
jgi:hypothetical protein